MDFRALKASNLAMETIWTFKSSHIRKHFYFFKSFKLGQIDKMPRGLNHVVPVTSSDGFRDLKLSRLEYFRALKSVGPIGVV